MQGYNEAMLKLKRHQLHETVKGCSPFWMQILVATCLKCMRIYICFVALLFFHHSSFIADWCLRAAKVTPEAQHLHFKKYNLWWSLNCKKMKKTMRARHRWSEENWNKNVDHCCLAVFCLNEVEKLNDSRITQNMVDQMMDSFLNGHLSG